MRYSFIKRNCYENCQWNLESASILSGIEPPRMNWLAADLPTEFRSFKQYCELIFSGPFRDKEQAERVTYILLWVGQEGL